MLNSKVLENANGDKYTLTSQKKGIFKDKKANAEFWDIVEGLGEQMYIQVAKNLGINILEIGDLEDIKQLTALAVFLVEKNYEEAKAPSINENL